MPEWYNTLQEDGTPSSVSAFFSPGAPTLGSIVGRSGKLKGNDFHSVSCLRVSLAILASMAAIALLVVSCSRLLERRPLQELRSRKLASSEESGVQMDICGDTREEEEEPENHSPHPPNLPGGGERHLPLKKRLLVRTTELGAAGGTSWRGSNPQQKEQQQQHNQTVAAAFGLPAAQQASSPAHWGSPSLAAPTPPPVAPLRSLEEANAAAGQLYILPYQHGAPYLAGGTRGTASPNVRQLQQELRWLQLQQERERQHWQSKVQWDDQEELYPQQQQQQQLNWQYLLWQHQLRQVQQEQEHQNVIQGQQQQYHVAAVPIGTSPGQTIPFSQQFGFPPFAGQSQLHSSQVRPQTEPDAATGLLDSRHHHHADGHFASRSRQPVPIQVRQLQRQLRRMQRQLHRELPRLQRQLYRLQQQLQRERRHRRQQQAQLHQQHLHQEEMRESQQQNLHRKQLAWQQKQKLHYLGQQPRQQQQQEQQFLMQPQGQQQVVHGQEHHAVKQGDQQGMLQEHQPQPDEHTGIREQQREPTPLEGVHQQPLRPLDSPAGRLIIDEWIEPESPTPEDPQPSTSQQASQPPGAPAPPGPSKSEYFLMQVIPGFSLTASDASPGAAAVASRDEAAAAPAAGAAAASAAASHGLHSSGTASAAPRRTGEGMGLEIPALSGLNKQRSAEGAEAAGAGRSATEAGGAARPVSASTASAMELLQSPNASLAAMKEHPFVRLPTPSVEDIPSSLFIDLKSAKNPRRSTRNIVPLLQRAHDLLVQRCLSYPQLKDLACVASDLVESAVYNQQQDLSTHKRCRAVDRLGIRFLILDAVVSAFIVLGQKPEPDLWKSFTDAISHAAPPPVVNRNDRERQAFLLYLSQKLSKAIQTLKTGRRPHPADLLQIKWSLFCSPAPPARFKTSEFHRWRADDRSDTDGSQGGSP